MLNNKILFTTALLFGFFFNPTPVSAATINVNVGESIQTKCLDVVKAGDSCTISAGTYNITSPLTMITTGTQTAPITLKCATNKGCTINSGSERSLVTYAGRRLGYYIVDGFRFISTFVNNIENQDLASVNFARQYWSDTNGNDGFILRNCYIEGAVNFFGANNLVENCELNGKGVVSNGISERHTPSKNNIYRNNNIHDYTYRGGWSLQKTQSTLWENNVIYNIGINSGIDCDGAGSAVYGCNIKNNTFYNIQNGALLLENSFDSVVEGNIIHDAKGGIGAINYNISNGSDTFKSDKDYKGMMTNTIIRNNVIYNIANDGIGGSAVRGNQAYNNTLYNIKMTRGYYGAIVLSGYTQIGSPDWVIKNNIVANSPGDMYIFGSTAETINYNYYDSFSASLNPGGSKTYAQWQALSYDLNGKVGDPLFVNAAAGDFHLQPTSPACTAGEGGTHVGAFPCTTTTSPSPSASPSPSGKPGDANGNSKVDGVDYVVWLNNYGKTITGGPTVGDFNSSGKVDGVDYVLWVNNYGR